MCQPPTCLCPVSSPAHGHSVSPAVFPWVSPLRQLPWSLFLCTETTRSWFTGDQTQGRWLTVWLQGPLPYSGAQSPAVAGSTLCGSHSCPPPRWALHSFVPLCQSQGCHSQSVKTRTRGLCFCGQGGSVLRETMGSRGKAFYVPVSGSYDMSLSVPLPFSDFGTDCASVLLLGHLWLPAILFLRPGIWHQLSPVFPHCLHAEEAPPSKSGKEAERK